MLLNSTEYFLTSLCFEAAIKIAEISKEYWNLTLVFSEKLADKLLEHGKHDDEIETEDKQPLFEPIYNLSMIELGMLQAYINKNLKKSFIKESQWLSEASIQFVKKKYGLLHLCVNY